MKRLLVGAALGALLLPASLAFAHDGHDHECVDDVCTVQALFQTAPAEGASGFQGVEAPRYGTWGFDLNGRDTSVKPGDDFFEYVGGTWIKNTEIPADKTNYGSFTALRDKAEADVKATIEENAKGQHEPGSAGQKVGDFYNAFLNTDLIEQ